MPNHWRDILTTSGLHPDNRGYSVNPSQTDGSQPEWHNGYICDLSHLEFVRASGPDALDFLQAQLTNDLKQLTATDSQLSGYCTPKGRLLCIFRIHHAHAGLFLQAHKEVLAATVDRLRRYILRAKLELDIDEEVVSFGVVGDRCCKLLADLTGPLPDGKDGCLVAGNWTILCHSTSNPLRYQVIGTSSALTPLWQSLQQTCPVAGSRAWAGIDIHQGLPTIFQATSEQFVPQMVNMDIIGGVSFHKGCFPGQEIVARMHYLGKVKTRMVLGRIDAGAIPLPGEKLYRPNSEQSTGMVVDAIPAAGGCDLLATARLAALAAGDLRLGSADGATVQRRELPYRLDEPEQQQA
jgi:folate-binding protein YgfZ